ncbi:MAG: hypothetical protein KKB81_07750 [Candidatus Margulisbacteria bacterium]|nr:hypothetical protein [Candidatus Margulisiibacteriota bacterium]MBU1021243.1 hypothetical protein [Candidatus Margulisiibacteriota bacterium]MBU1729848.1 hypothetical protein [Candidatus Margulisiibacteriota bacterium]MBU1768012.1 hypothetical protein [Candidatus Omnitrophota bacterium]MBU1955349.1 hypothetical protein [Candidatus Margulisiibacteriota bacterium]
MDLKVVNCVLAEYVRPEPGGKITAIGVPLVIQLPDVTKPCYPLTCFLQLQGTETGEADLTFHLRDVEQKKDVASFKNKIKVPARKKEGKGKTFNVVQIQPLSRIVFGRMGEFDAIVTIDKTIKKTFKVQVVEVKQPRQGPAKAA